MVWRRAAAVAAVLAPLAAAAAAGPVTAVTTPGSGDLTMCRDWFVYNACDTYHHVALPGHIAVGDQIPLVFGTSDKQYDFHVIGIHRQGNACTILSPESGKQGRGEHLAVEPCQLVPKSTAER